MHPIASYEMIDVSYPFRLRGPGHQQDDYGIMHPSLTHRQNQTGGNPTTTTALSGGLALGGFSMHNRCGTTCAVGIGVRIPNRLWKAGQWTEVGTTFTDDTEDAQDVGTADFPVETTDDDDGFVIMSRVPFNTVSFDVSTTSVGGAPVRAVRYSTIVSGTSAWSTALTNTFVHTASTGHYVITATTAANEGLIVFGMPADFTKTISDGALGTGIDGDVYAINVRSTTAPTGSGGALDSMSIYRMYFLTEALADNGVYEAFFGASEARMLDEGDAMVAFFETANSGNLVRMFVRTAR